MINRLLFCIALSVPLALAACGSRDAEAPAPAEAAPAAEAPATPDTAAPVPEASAPMDAPTAAASADGIRGPGGLEEKCQQRVAQETGAKVNGTNRIEESEAAIEVYVNVEGAQAPWKCSGSRDGTISEVMFTGDEGAA